MAKKSDNKKTSRIKPIFLYDPTIRRWGDYQDVDKQLGVPDTRLVDFLGLETLELGDSPYRLKGSVAVYLADVMRYDEVNDHDKLPSCGDGKFEHSRELLFHGGVQIYKGGQIKGTEVNGLQLVAQGKVFVAKKQVTARWGDGSFLCHFLKGRSSERTTQKIIEAIAAGYIVQEVEETQRRHNLSKEASEEAVRDALEGIDALYVY